MSKEKEQAQEQEQQTQQPAAEAVTVPAGSPASETTAVPDNYPSGIESPVILRAKSREELDTQFQELKAKYDGHSLTAGAVARNSDDGTYILRIDIIFKYQ